MNIGFHYYVTKTLAIKAGFSHKDAELIAYACQYVDDATDHQVMIVKDMPEPLYERMYEEYFDPTCTSHKGINNILYNFPNIRNKVLLPYHFIPEGWNKERKKFNYLTIPEAPMSLKLVDLALEKIRSAKKDSQIRDTALIQLGIALHSYEDTFAHQNFSARNNQKDNGVTDPIIRSNNRRRTNPFVGRLTGFLGYHIGHGLLGTFPDRINTEITYIDGRKNRVYINTKVRFIQAARRVFDIFRSITGTPDTWGKLLQQLDVCMEVNRSRRSDWKRAFSAQFKGTDYSYNPNQWKNITIRRDRDGNYRFSGDPIWFLYHQAAYEQRKHVMTHLMN